MLSRHRAHSNLLALLRSASRRDSLPPLSCFDDRQIRWIIKTGLAPLLCYLSQNDSNSPASPHWREVQAADLSIRLLNETQFQTLSEILKRCGDRLPPITLLKGCSVASEFYPEPQLRVMRDLDLLVEPGKQTVLESILFAMGFRQQSSNSPAYYVKHHHSMPFYNPTTGVWVEVHRGLFRSGEKLAGLPVFSREKIAAESRFSKLEGITVMRLAPELQIVYTASHWTLGLVDLKHEGGLFALLDIIFILRAEEKNLRWDLILNWVKDSVAATHLYLLLSYLYCNDICDIDRQILRELFERQKSFGAFNLKIAHRLITRYLVAGKIPIARGKLSILWKNLLLDQGPAGNLASFVNEICRLPGMPKGQFEVP